MAEDGLWLALTDDGALEVPDAAWQYPGQSAAGPPQVDFVLGGVANIPRTHFRSRPQCITVPDRSRHKSILGWQTGMAGGWGGEVCL